MTLFFLAFFTLYGLMHAYLLAKIRAAFALSSLASAAAMSAMAVMVMMPYLVRVSERAGYETAARVLSFVGYFWMGGILLFVASAGIVDLYRVLLSLASSIGRPLPLPGPTAMAGLVIPLVVSALVNVYGYFEAKHIRVEHHTVRSGRIPLDAGRVRVVQISDVHLGLMIRHERLRMVLDKVRESGPDILVSTGDLVDGQINSMAGLAELFQEIRPRYGKFAVTGNHEFYAGLPQAIEFTEKAGFRMLRNESADIGGFMAIAGVDDPTVKRYGLAGNVDEGTVLPGPEDGRFVLLLKHRPIVSLGSAGRFDLQLSGHVHRGQIFPFSILTHFYYPVDAGLVSLTSRSWLFVSRGTGTWGPPIRFLSPPEVTVIDLISAKAE